MGKSISVQRVISILLRRIKLIIVAGVIGGLLAFLYASFLITPMYSTSTMIFIQNYNKSASTDADSSQGSAISSDANSSNNKVAQKIFSSDISGSAQLAKICVTLFQNSDEITALYDGCGVSIYVADDTFYITISVSGSDPIKCANVANQIAQKCQDVFNQRFDYGQIGTIREAREPSSPYSPNIPRNTTVGIGAGLIIACVIAVLLELIDTTIKSDDDIQTMYGIPVFAEIPDFENESR